jgi:transcriptional regulator with XRE-family HTH domain
MKREKWFSEAVTEYKNDVDYLTEVAILDFTEKIVAKMKEQDLSRAELAKRLGVSKAFITKVLGGYPNLTIRSMVSFANALGCDLSLEILQQGFRANRIYQKPLRETVLRDK